MAQQGFLLAILDELDVSDLLDDEDDVFILSVASTYMRRSLNRIEGYFEVTVPSYFGDEFKKRIWQGPYPARKTNFSFFVDDGKRQ